MLKSQEELLERAEKAEARVEYLEGAWDDMRSDILQGGWIPDAGGNVVNAALDVIDEHYPEEP